MFYSPFNRSCLQFFRQRVHTSRQWGGTHYHMTHRPKCAWRCMTADIRHMYTFFITRVLANAGALVLKVGIGI